MSFAKQIKIEIINKEFSREEALIFIEGIIFSSSVNIGNQTIIKMNNIDFANNIREMLDQLNIKHNVNSDNHNWISIDKHERKFEIKLAGPFFAGAFFANGSISDLKTSSYHLEVQFYRRDEALMAQDFLNNKTIYFNFEWKIIQRRMMWIIYIKKAEQISDFLKAIGAQNSMFNFEQQRIDREYYNQINRYNNFDIYNIKKLTNSWNDFNIIWQELKEHGLEFKFRENEIKFFELRVKHPESSLSQLVVLLKDEEQIIKTKSGLNHWLIKLRKIYDSNI